MARPEENRKSLILLQERTWRIHQLGMQQLLPPATRARAAQSRRAAVGARPSKLSSISISQGNWGWAGWLAMASLCFSPSPVLLGPINQLLELLSSPAGSRAPLLMWNSISPLIWHQVDYFLFHSNFTHQAASLWIRIYTVPQILLKQFLRCFMSSVLVYRGATHTPSLIASASNIFCCAFTALFSKGVFAS